MSNFIKNICVFIKKENISRDVVILSILFNTLLSIFMVLFISPFFKKHTEITTSYYILMTIFPIIINIVIGTAINQLYKLKKKFMGENAISVKTDDENLIAVQDNIRKDLYNTVINDYVEEFM